VQVSIRLAAQCRCLPVNSDVKARVGLPAIKQKAGEILLGAIDVAGIVLAGSGAAVVAFLGKLMTAVVLGAICLGFFLRLAGRRRGPAVVLPKPPAWSRAVSVLVSTVLVATLVEATDLPVRFHQPGFEPWHWLLVVAALVVAYSLCVRVVGALTGRMSKHVAPQP
jgi:hypothetical protein